MWNDLLRPIIVSLCKVLVFGLPCTYIWDTGAKRKRPLQLINPVYNLPKLDIVLHVNRVKHI